MRTEIKKIIAIAVVMITLALIWMNFIESTWYLDFELFMLNRLIASASLLYLAWLAYKFRFFDWVWVFSFLALIFIPYFLDHVFGYNMKLVSYSFSLGRDVRYSLRLEAPLLQHYLNLWRLIAAGVAAFLFAPLFLFKPK